MSHRIAIITAVAMLIGVTQIKAEVQAYPEINLKDIVSTVEAAVRMSFEAGDEIAVVEVTDNQSFLPSVGDRGARCAVKKYQLLFPLDEKRKPSFKAGVRIYLYPYTAE